MWRCDIDVMQSNLHQDLDNLYYWFRDNKLIFKLSVNGSPIYTITCYRYLGVHLDPTLNYDTHFHEMHKKVAARVNLFRRIRSSNDTSSALRIYQSMIMPILTLAIIIVLDGQSPANAWSALLRPEASK